MRAALLLLVLSACSESPAPGAAPPAAPPAANPVGNTAAPAAAPPSSGPTPFEQKSFECCTTPAAISAVGQYLEVQRALAADNIDGAVGAATKLAATFDTLAASAPAAEATTLKKLAEETRALTGTDAKAIRKSFGPLSADLITWAVPLPQGAAVFGGSFRVAKAYCPMADAAWLQTDATISNPYYGAEMLTCGSFQ